MCRFKISTSESVSQGKARQGKELRAPHELRGHAEQRIRARRPQRKPYREASACTPYCTVPRAVARRARVARGVPGPACRPSRGDRIAARRPPGRAAPAEARSRIHKSHNIYHSTTSYVNISIAFVRISHHKSAVQRHSQQTGIPLIVYGCRIVRDARHRTASNNLGTEPSTEHGAYGTMDGARGIATNI